MWYTTLVGDPTLYTTSFRRVTLNGNGSNIHLSDLAILGKLNYRNDSEPNDGLGGAYGTGSTISRIWVEHTKTGAWIVNSSGLVVDSLAVGMRSTTVTNCTTRGTGDDCFAIWPATYLTPVYAPGLNVITHCTGLVPFLANGGAIYGGDSNRIEDCLFQDIPYFCGILISTEFPVSTNFSGTTVAQRCDLNRCGGTGAGLQISLHNRGISGMNLNNLNISNSVTYGLNVIYGAGGGLSNAIMSNVNIPNYGVGALGVHGLWARNDAVGSMTVSNCPLVEYKNDSSNFTFNFVTSNVPVTVQTGLPGLTFAVDGTNYSSAQALNWLYGSSHTIASTSPQSGGTGIQYVWNSWNDGGAISHSVTASTNMTYTANFATQYFLTMNAATGGSVNPASGWNNSNAVVNISATASNSYAFSGWTGGGSGSYSGTNGPTSITMNGPITETAGFDFLPVITGFTIGNDGSVTIGYSTTSGLTYHVETTTDLASYAWTTMPGSTTSAAGGIIIFVDPNAMGDPQRFYRVGSP